MSDNTRVFDFDAWQRGRGRVDDYYKTRGPKLSEEDLDAIDDEEDDWDRDEDDDFDETW